MLRPIVTATILALVAGPVMAADVAITPDSSSGYGSASPWARPYIGLFGGIGAGNFSYQASAPGGTGTFDITGGGILGGLRGGYDYAIGNVLIGIVGDYARTDVKADADISSSFSGPLGNIEAKVTGLGTLRARFGITNKNNLYYLHGGLAVGDVDITADGKAIPGVTTNPRIGFAVGVGYEYAVARNATLQTEYSYVDLGQQNIYSYGADTVSDHITFSELTAGLNLRF